MTQIPPHHQIPQMPVENKVPQTSTDQKPTPSVPVPQQPSDSSVAASPLPQSITELPLTIPENLLTLESGDVESTYDVNAWCVKGRDFTLKGENALIQVRGEADLRIERDRIVVNPGSKGVLTIQPGDRAISVQLPSMHYEIRQDGQVLQSGRSQLGEALSKSGRVVSDNDVPQIRHEDQIAGFPLVFILITGILTGCAANSSPTQPNRPQPQPSKKPSPQATPTPRPSSTPQPPKPVWHALPLAASEAQMKKGLESSPLYQGRPESIQLAGAAWSFTRTAWQKATNPDHKAELANMMRVLQSGQVGLVKDDPAFKRMRPETRAFYQAVTNITTMRTSWNPQMLGEQALFIHELKHAHDDLSVYEPQYDEIVNFLPGYDTKINPEWPQSERVNQIDEALPHSKLRLNFDYKRAHSEKDPVAAVNLETSAFRAEAEFLLVMAGYTDPREEGPKSLRARLSNPATGSQTLHELVDAFRKAGLFRHPDGSEFPPAYDPMKVVLEYLNLPKRLYSFPSGQMLPVDIQLGGRNLTQWLEKHYTQHVDKNRYKGGSRPEP